MMTIRDFKHLSEEVQRAYVFQRGTYIARRWDDFHQACSTNRRREGGNVGRERGK